MTTTYAPLSVQKVIELFTSAGSHPLKNWKISGGVKGMGKSSTPSVLTYEREIKGFCYVLKNSRMDINCLSIAHSVIVVQAFIPETPSFSIEMGILDNSKSKRRIYFSHSIRELKVTPLSCSLPLQVENSTWINFIFDLDSLIKHLYKNQTFLHLDSLTIAGHLCKIRKVFTLKSSYDLDYNTLIPLSLNFPNQHVDLGITFPIESNTEKHLLPPSSDKKIGKAPLPKIHKPHPPLLPEKPKDETMKEIPPKNLQNRYPIAPKEESKIISQITNHVRQNTNSSDKPKKDALKQEKPIQNPASKLPKSVKKETNLQRKPVIVSERKAKEGNKTSVPKRKPENESSIESSLSCLNSLSIDKIEEIDCTEINYRPEILDEKDYTPNIQAELSHTAIEEEQGELDHYDADKYIMKLKKLYEYVSSSGNTLLNHEQEVKSEDKPNSNNNNISLCSMEAKNPTESITPEDIDSELLEMLNGSETLVKSASLLLKGLKEDL